MKDSYSSDLDSFIISKKIYRENEYKTKAFLVSVMLHATLFAGGFYVLKTQKVVHESLSAPLHISLASYMPTPKPLKQEIKKEVVVAQKRETIAPKKVVKKEIQKELPKETVPTPQQMPQEIKEEVLPVEAFTPPLSKEENIVVNNDEMKPQYSPIESLMPLPKEQPTPKNKSEIEPTLLGLIRTMIQESLRYPALAKRLKLEGVVVVSFVLTRDGRVESAEIVQKSGSSSLDAKAIETVLSLSGSYPLLENEVTLQIPIAFSIKQS
jgi:protein TonB